MRANASCKNSVLSTNAIGDMRPPTHYKLFSVPLAVPKGKFNKLCLGACLLAFWPNACPPYLRRRFSVADNFFLSRQKIAQSTICFCLASTFQLVQQRRSSLTLYKNAAAQRYFNNQFPFFSATFAVMFQHGETFELNSNYFVDSGVRALVPE